VTYKDRLKSVASSVLFFVEENTRDKTGSMKSCDLSPPTYVTLNPQLFITPVH
jgi:hypothetical protein